MCDSNLRRRDVLKVTGAATTGVAGLTTASSSGVADSPEVVEIRVWTHESVSNGLSADRWLLTFEPLVSQAVRGMGHILSHFGFDLDTYYAEFRNGYYDPTPGNLPTDPDAGDLRELTPDFADHENNVNVHLIYDSDSDLGRSSARCHEDEDSGECYVNLGFLDEDVIYYLYPEIVIHEALHCIMSDGGQPEHEHGTPAWDGTGTPTVMGTGYSHDKVNSWWGSQVPLVDCNGDDWSDGAISWIPTSPPDPQPVLTDCTVSAVGDHLQATAIGPYDINYEYESDYVIPWPADAMIESDSVERQPPIPKIEPDSVERQPSSYRNESDIVEPQPPESTD